MDKKGQKIQGERSFKALEMELIDLLQIRITKRESRNGLTGRSVAEPWFWKARLSTPVVNAGWMRP